MNSVIIINVKLIVEKLAKSEHACATTKTWDESNKLNRLKNSFFLFYHSTVFTKGNSHFEDEINKNKNQR